ncbi:prohibitin family protein [Cardiobacterium hominis]|jgi:SPFH/band 7 family protein|uniref:Membrane protease family protein y2843 n=1 Tax=Cardiobacterium hominis TaxID=2718 RepID=A0A1C3H3X2_9GAMM|nr:prohibitin family protein [Cardiobacterium hominis]SAM62858.1 Membrane protease family protein y2843 [Cardiobacterium hominis]
MNIKNTITPPVTDDNLPPAAPRKSKAPLVTLIISAVAVLILLMTTGGSMYTVDQGERGVVLHYGEVSKVADPGLHFKWPYVDRVVRVPTRTTTGTMKDIFAYSSDQQPAQIALSVTFAVTDDGVEDLYTQFGKIDNLYELAIVPIVKQEIKTVFGQFTAIRSVQHREELNNKTRDAIVGALAKYPYLRIESVQIENVDFSDAYEQTIEDRMKAEVEVERYKQNLERERIEAQIAATRAQGQADAQIKAAEAEAKAIELRSKAEADSINTKGEALRKNPEIIRLIQTEKWNGILPQTMLPNSTVPMLELPAPRTDTP